MGTLNVASTVLGNTHHPHQLWTDIDIRRNILKASRKHHIFDGHNQYMVVRCNGYEACSRG